jgi:hypothetical protein
MDNRAARLQQRQDDIGIVLAATMKDDALGFPWLRVSRKDVDFVAGPRKRLGQCEP